MLQCYDTLGNLYAIPKYCLSAPTNIIKPQQSSGDTFECAGEEDDDKPDGLEDMVEIKLRLSTMKDVKVNVSTAATVRDIKKKLFKQEGIQPQNFKLLFSGRILKDDDCLEDLKIPKGFIIQAIVSS